MGNLLSIESLRLLTWKCRYSLDTLSCATLWMFTGLLVSHDIPVFTCSGICVVCGDTVCTIKHPIMVSTPDDVQATIIDIHESVLLAQKLDQDPTIRELKCAKLTVTNLSNK